MLKYLAILVLALAQAIGGDVLSGVTGGGGGGGSCTPSPCIDSVSGGTLTDGETSIVIAGLGFGTKSTAAPTMWDDATSGNINTHGWDDAYQLSYSTGDGTIAMPHSHATHYMYGLPNGANGGIDVAIRRDVGSLPAFVTVSYYYRMKPGWTFFGTGEDNQKYFEWNADTAFPLGGSNYWYDNYHYTSEGDTSDASTNALPGDDVVAYGSPVNPFSNWVHRKYLLRADSTTSGRLMKWENGAQHYNFTGVTDWGTGVGTDRTVGLGGYFRPYDNSTNYIYIADAYIDYSWAQVIIANTSTLGTAPRWAHQIPTAWTSTSVTITVNLGELASETAYVFVCNSTNTCTPGFAVTVGS